MDASVKTATAFCTEQKLYIETFARLHKGIEAEVQVQLTSTHWKKLKKNSTWVEIKWLLLLCCVAVIMTTG